MNTPAPKTSPDAALGNLMAAALDVPAPSEQPEVPAWAPDNTPSNAPVALDAAQDGTAPLGVLLSVWNAMQNAADGNDLLSRLEHMRGSIARAVWLASDVQPRRDWPTIQAAIDEYLDGYELRADEGAHTPTDFERFLLDDCIAGLLAEDDILALLAGATAPAARDALDPNHRPDLHYILGVLDRLAKAAPKDQELAAALNGMRYVVSRTDAAIAAQLGKGGAT